MRRRDLIIGTIAAVGGAISGATKGQELAARGKRFVAEGAPLKTPANGIFKVAFAISDMVTPIDIFGPWEVFMNTTKDDWNRQTPFELFTVSQTRDVVISGGLRLFRATRSMSHPLRR